MASSQLDQKTERAIRISLEKFKLEHLALLGIRPDEPVIETTHKVLSSPSITPCDVRVFANFLLAVPPFNELSSLAQVMILYQSTLSLMTIFKVSTRDSLR